MKGSLVRRPPVKIWRVMKQRIDGMSALGIDTEFHSYPGLSHGFGLGTGTVAEGWIDQAIAFWQRQYLPVGTGHRILWFGRIR